MWWGWRHLFVFGLLSAKPILPGNAPIRVYEHRFKPDETGSIRLRRDGDEDYEYDYDYAEYEETLANLTARSETVAETTIHFLRPEEVS